MTVWDECQAERERAHAKHGDTSMEALPVDDLTRLTVLMEEVGEVAREFNEARHKPPLDRDALRKELIQVATMAGAWADALGYCCIHRPYDHDQHGCAVDVSTTRGVYERCHS